MSINKIVLLTFISVSILFGQNLPAIKIASFAQSPSISTSKDGKIFIGWGQSDSSYFGNSSYYACFDSAGNILLTPLCLSNYCTAPPSLIPGDTAVLALWTASIMEMYPYGQFFKFDGRAASNRFSFPQGSQLVGFYLEDTSYSVAWKGYTSRVFTSVFNKGSWSRNDTLLSGSTNSIVRIEYLPGKNSKYLAWSERNQSAYSIFIQKYSLSNQPVGQIIALNRDTTISGIYSFNTTMRPDSSIAIVWSGKKNNVWRIFRNTLQTNDVLSPTETITTDDVDVCTEAGVSVAYGITGESLIGFEGKTISYMQRFDSQGTKLGGHIPLMKESGTTFYPAVALWHKTIHAAWTENTSAGNAVWYQVFDFNNPLNAVDNSAHNKEVTQFALLQNYPNPFNPSTTIQYSVPAYGMVSIKIYNAIGKEVATLVNEVKQPGMYSVNFNAADLPSGIYLCQIISGDFSAIRKMILLK